MPRTSLCMNMSLNHNETNMGKNEHTRTLVVNEGGGGGH